MVGETLEIGVQLAPLLRRQRREQVLLRLGDGGLGAAKAPGSSRRQLDELASAIARIAAADDQSLGLELVEEGDEVRGMEPKRPAQLPAMS